MLDRVVTLQSEQRYRIGFITGLFGMMFFLLFSMLFERQIIQYRHYSVMAKQQHVNSQVVPAQRGKVLVQENNDELYPLATNVTLFALQVVPSQIKRPELVASKLMPFLAGSGIEESDLIAKLSTKAKYTPPLKRKIGETEAQQISD